jgi:hypothetical protein
MDHKKWEQVGGGAGIVAVAMFVVAMALPGTIQPEDSAGEIRQFMIDNRDQMLAQAALVAGGVLLFLLFLATFRNVLRRTEVETGELSAIMSGSALVALTMILTAVAVSAGVVYRSATAIDPTLARVVFDAVTVVFAFVGIPTAVFAGTAAVLMRRSAAFPAWMPALAAVAAVLNALTPLTIFFTEGAWAPMGWASYVPSAALFLFVVGCGAVLVRHPEAGEARMPMAVHQPI